MPGNVTYHVSRITHHANRARGVRETYTRVDLDKPLARCAPAFALLTFMHRAAISSAEGAALSDKVPFSF